MSDKLIDLFKFIVSNWRLIIPILAFCGISGYASYHYTKPVEAVEIPLSLPEPAKEISPPQPPQVIERVIIKESCEKVCGEMIHRHEARFHFAD